MLRWARVVVAVLAVQFVAVGGVLAWTDAPTIDEAIDVAAGTTSLARRDLRLMPEHGPLPKLLMGVPTLLVQPVIPDGPGYRTAEHLVHTAEFVAANDEAGKLRVGDVRRPDRRPPRGARRRRVCSSSSGVAGSASWPASSRQPPGCRRRSSSASPTSP